MYIIKSKYSLIVFLLTLFSLQLSAQTTKVKGKVVDAVSREPLPFVNIILKGTRAGATTDLDGYYTITTTEKSDSLVISYIGYNRVARFIKIGQEQDVNIGLTQGVELMTIEITPGENPAHRILKKVIANKDKNNTERLTAYEYEVYNKIEFDINNIDDDFKNKKLLQPFSFIFDNIDSSNIKEKPYLPVFMTESLSDYYFRKNPKIHNEVIKATKVAGIENASVSQFMGDMYQKVNIYDNTIIVFGKNFVSPISDNALFYYKFYLIDSMEIDGYKCYQLKFKPKRKQELAFVGNLWVTDSSYAIKQIEMSIADDANINFINSTAIVQTFQEVNDAWLVKKEKLVIDFNPYPIEQKKKSMLGIYGRRTASYDKFTVNAPREDKFYSFTENLKVKDDAFDKNDDFWVKNRHDSLSLNEKQIYHMVDTLQSLPIYRSWIDIIQLFVTGYKIHGNFEYGPYYSIYSYNQIEGNRFRFGGRTSNQFSKWYELSGYVAFGVRDEKFKYSFGMRTFIEKKNRTMAGMYYKNDNEILGQSQNGFTADNILASIFRITPLTNLTNVRQVHAYLERQWFPGFSSKLSFFNRQMSPLADFKYEYYKKPNTIAEKQSIVTSEFRLLTRFAYDEKYLDGTFSRSSLGTRYPVLQAQYTLGVKDLFFSDYNYHKLVLNVDDRIRINPIGYFDYVLEYGKTWGQLPYPLMTIHGGNETYVSDIYAFNGMNYYEFVSDEYASATISHHFDGFFLNRIPLMRKLKWREVVGGKVLIGTANQQNKDVLIFPTFLNTLNRGPYMEASAGIENIFKIFRIDGIWRLSYLDNPRAIPFAIKGTMQFVF